MARIDELEAKLNRLLAEGVRAPEEPEAPQPLRASPVVPEKISPEPPAQTQFAVPEHAAPKPDAVPQPSGPPEPMNEEQWRGILERLTVTNKMLAAALTGSRAFLRGQTVLVECHNPVFLEMMRSNDFTRSSLKRAISEVTGARYGVGPYTPENEAAPLENVPSPLESLLKEAEDQGVKVIRK